MPGSNTGRVLLAAAARVANTQSAKFNEAFGPESLRLYLNVTVASGSGGLRVILRGYDRASGGSVELTTGGTPVTTTGLFAYEISGACVPSNTFGAIREVACRTIPVVWDVIVRVLDGSTYNYSLSADVT